MRRALGAPEGQAEVEAWFCPPALGPRLRRCAIVERIWEVLEAFASFGFCKAHAAAFALPTYQSAWLKAHHPAAFLAGVLTHDPGMYPKRLILDDARQLGIAVLGLDVNASDDAYRVERVGRRATSRRPAILGAARRAPATRPGRRGLPDGRAYGIRLVAGRRQGHQRRRGRPDRRRPALPSLADFWHRAQVSRPVVERLVVAGAFDSLYGLGLAGCRSAAAARSPGATCCCRWPSSTGGPGRSSGRPGRALAARSRPAAGRRAAPTPRSASRRRPARGARRSCERTLAAAAVARRPPVAAARPPDLQPVQLTLDLGDAPDADRGRRAAGDDRAPSGSGPSSRSSASTPAGTSSTSTPRCSTRSA